MLITWRNQIMWRNMSHCNTGACRALLIGNVGTKDPGIVVTCLNLVSTKKIFASCWKEDKDKCGAFKVVGHVADRRRRWLYETKKKYEEKKMEVEHQKLVSRMIASP